jgi:hypothetical protein
MSKDKALFTFTDDQAADVFSFPVTFEITGSNPGKLIETGHDGIAISTSPGWKLTVSGDPDGDGILTELLTTNINGIIKIIPHEDGTIQFDYSGPSLVTDPPNAGDPGVAYYALLSGHYTWTGDASLNTVEPLSGHGPITDLHDLLT